MRLSLKEADTGTEGEKKTGLQHDSISARRTATAEHRTGDDESDDENDPEGRNVERARQKQYQLNR